MITVIISAIISAYISSLMRTFVISRYFSKLNEGWERTFEEMKKITRDELEKRIPR